MIGDIHMKLGGTALSARLEYEGVLARRLGRLWRGPARSVSPRTASAHSASPRITSDIRASADVFSVSETLEKVAVVFGVPGYGRDELLLEATSHSVRLMSREPSTERRSGRALDVVVPLPEAVEPERVAASLQDGLLTVDLPKAAWVQGKARRVPIQADQPSVARTADHQDQPDNQA